MPHRIVLASGSAIRADLLRRAGLTFTVIPARVDETALRASLDAEGASPRDQADALAEMKSRRVSEKAPDALVIGCDQVLDHGGTVLSKPGNREEARAQLMALRGTAHVLFSAVVVHVDRRPVWRHVGVARLHMRNFSDAFLDGYLSRHGKNLDETVGGYRLEEEGVRLFETIDGDYFTVLGLPLLPLLGYLCERGVIET